MNTKMDHSDEDDDLDITINRYYKHYSPWYNIFQEYSTLLNVTIPKVFGGARFNGPTDITFLITNIRYVYVYDSFEEFINVHRNICLLYTYDAADERSSVDLGGRRI